MATYTGTSGNDNLAGTSAADLILGDMGNDNIAGNGGQDSLYGGMGNDNIIFGPTTGPGAPLIDTSSVLIYGGTGSDTITATNNPSGFNTIYGGTGNAALDSTDGANVFNLASDQSSDFVFAGGGGDSITLGSGSGSSVTGGVGNDTINAGFGSRVAVNADQGNDSIIGSFGGGDLLHGGIGNDTITLNNAGNRSGSVVAADLNDDIINDLGGTASDSLYGGRGNDSITLSGSGNDLVFAGFDSDTINVTGSGVDSIYGGTDTTGTATDGANLISAVAKGQFDATTFIAGVDGNNGVNAASNRVLLVGGGGNDTIIASTSTNVTNAGTAGAAAAIDTLTGGGGNDLFVFGQTTLGAPAGIATGYSNAAFQGGGVVAPANSSGATTASTVDSVTDFVSSADKFRFGTKNGTINVNNTSTTQTAVDNALKGANPNTLQTAANAAAATLGSGAANSQAVLFSFQNSNYLFVKNDNQNVFTTDDYLINVNGLTNVTSSDLNG